MAAEWVARKEVRHDLSWLKHSLLKERLEVERLLSLRHQELMQQLQRQLDPAPALASAVAAQVAPAAGDNTAPTAFEVVKLVPSQGPSQTPKSPREQPNRMRVEPTIGTSLPSELLEEFPQGEGPESRETLKSRIFARLDVSHQEGVNLAEGALDASERDPSESVSTVVASALHQWSKTWWHSYLDVIAGVIILLNLLFCALQYQYSSFDLRCTIDKGPDCRTSEQMWPGALMVFDVIDFIFAGCFLTELVVRLAFRVNFPREMLWNMMDACFIALWIIQRTAASLGFDPTLLRVLRLVRLFRIARLVKNFRMLDPLFLIFKAIQSSMNVLFWSCVMLALLMMLMAMINTTLLSSFISDDLADTDARLLVYQSWGSFARAYVTMFEITLANWGPQCWLLVNHVNIAWGFFFIVWRCCFGFAVIQVITSVFIQHTFKVASRDEDIMIKEKEKASQAFMSHLDRLFASLDESGDGHISKEEFEAAMSSPRIAHYFGALEIDISDVPRIFAMLDDGDGEVTKEEFVDGLKKLKGSAMSIDLWALTKEVQRMNNLFKESLLEGAVPRSI